MEQACMKKVSGRQLEVQYDQIKLSIEEESKRLERINSQLFLTQQQLAVYSQEFENIHLKLQFCNEKFNIDFCQELRSIPAPVSVLIEFADKFLLILGMKDRSWKSFRNLTKDFPTFKSLMTEAQSQPIPETIINEVLSLWKNQNLIKLKLFKTLPAASILFDWLIILIEYNLKSEIIKTSQKRVPELEKKIKSQKKILFELGKEQSAIEEFQLKNGIETENRDAEQSITSKPYSFLIEETNEIRAFHSTIQRGVLNQALMEKAEVREFPDFTGMNLYREIPVDGIKESEEGLLVENKSEKSGCCRLKFFCC